MDPLQQNYKMLTCLVIPLFFKCGITYKQVYMSNIIKITVAKNHKQIELDMIIKRKKVLDYLSNTTYTNNKQLYHITIVLNEFETNVVQLIMSENFLEIPDLYKEQILYFWNADNHTLLYNSLNNPLFYIRNNPTIINKTKINISPQ